MNRLPVEFVLTGIMPDPWTIETLLLRQITFGDAAGELQLARAVAELGAAEANRRRNPDPWDDLAVPEGLDLGAIGREVIEAARAAGRVPPARAARTLSPAGLRRSLVRAATSSIRAATTGS